MGSSLRREGYTPNQAVIAAREGWDHCLSGDTFRRRASVPAITLSDYWPAAFNSAWYAFQPGHQVVCQRHSLERRALGFSSARARMGHVAQLEAFLASSLMAGSCPIYLCWASNSGACSYNHTVLPPCQSGWHPVFLVFGLRSLYNPPGCAWTEAQPDRGRHAPIVSGHPGWIVSR